MALLRIIVEGQTEERVVNDLLAPHLADFQVYATPTLVNKSPRSTSRATKGGGRYYRPYQRDIVLSLKQNAEWFVTTMIDLYALPSGFPEPATLPTADPQRIGALEAALDADIRAEMGDVYPWRFVPYIQRHELEALLFVDPETTAEVIVPGDAGYATRLRAVRDAYLSPEDINDSQHTAPSKRLGDMYRKTRHAPDALGLVGVPTLRTDCPRFDAWLSRLEALGAS